MFYVSDYNIEGYSSSFQEVQTHGGDRPDEVPWEAFVEAQPAREGSSEVG